MPDVHVPDFALFATISDALFAVANGEGAFVWLSEAWPRTVGWSREELMSDEAGALVPRLPGAKA